MCLAGPAGEGCGEERGEVRGKYLFARLKVKEGVSEGGGASTGTGCERQTTMGPFDYSGINDRGGRREQD